MSSRSSRLPGMFDWWTKFLAPQKKYPSQNRQSQPTPMSSMLTSRLSDPRPRVAASCPAFRNFVCHGFVGDSSLCRSICMQHGRDSYGAEVTVMHVIPDIIEYFSTEAGVNLVSHMKKSEWQSFSQKTLKRPSRPFTNGFVRHQKKCLWRCLHARFPKIM